MYGLRARSLATQVGGRGIEAFVFAEAHQRVGQRDVVVGKLEGRIELTLSDAGVSHRVVLNRTREVVKAAQVHADLHYVFVECITLYQ